MKELFLRGYEIKGPTIQEIQKRQNLPMVSKGKEWTQRRQMRRITGSGRK